MRWFGFTDDPVAGGSSLEDLIAEGAGPDPTWAAPDTFVPVSAAQVDPGLTNLDRNNEVRGRRANAAPISFASAPSETFTARAYPPLLRSIIPKALSGTPANTGVAPAAISSTVGPIQSGDLKAIQAYLVRENQLDRVSGAVVEEFALNFPTDEEGSVDVTLRGLYHDVDPTDTVAGLPAADFTDFVGDTFMLRDVKAYLGAGAGVLIDCLAGFGLTWNNGLIDDMRSRFCAGKNIETTVIDAERHKLWYPDRHKLGPQSVTGRLDFGDVRPDRELRRILTHAEKLVVELTAGPIPAAVPAADEMLRFTLYKQAPTGGGAEPLVREGDQVSSYEFTAYLDETTNKDVEATFVGAAAIPG
jgi:hypothetical protein